MKIIANYNSFTKKSVKSNLTFKAEFSEIKRAVEREALNPKKLCDGKFVLVNQVSSFLDSYEKTASREKSAGATLPDSFSITLTPVTDLLVNEENAETKKQNLLNLVSDPFEVGTSIIS